MALVSTVWSWLLLNWGLVASLLLALEAVAQAYVRLTPSTADDEAVARIGGWINKLLDVLKVPKPEVKPPNDPVA